MAKRKNPDALRERWSECARALYREDGTPEQREAMRAEIRQLARSYAISVGNVRRAK